MAKDDLYAVLGVSGNRNASATELKRSYRLLASKAHPDKGGDATNFAELKTAYEILSDPARRAEYDRTCRVVKSIEEDFADGFGGGNFRNKANHQEVETTSISERIVLRKGADHQDHTSGFEAWMRARGDSATEVFTAESMAERFGVEKGSYESGPLPADVVVQQVVCSASGQPSDVLQLETQRLPHSLEWGEVLVSIRVAPINPADLSTAKTGGIYGSSAAALPFTAGHDCIGIVAKVGAGVKLLAPGDWVMPLKPLMGTWRPLAVWKHKDLLKVPNDIVPLEYGGMLREIFLAYRLIEDNGDKLKPGDCVILNAATSTVGQTIIQLCSILKLRVVALVRQPEKVTDWLKDLGASVVIAEAAAIKEELNALKFFGNPKLALDAVGGAARMSDALAEGGLTVCYGAMSGKAATWPWQSWVFREQQVKGFNLRRWLTRNPKKVEPMLLALSKLVNGGQLRLAYTDYELDEFTEALDHAMDAHRNTKILLRMPGFEQDNA